MYVHIINYDMYVHIIDSALNSKTARISYHDFRICTCHEFWIK